MGFSGLMLDWLVVVDWRVGVGANHVRSGDSAMLHFCFIEKALVYVEN